MKINILFLLFAILGMHMHAQLSRQQKLDSLKLKWQTDSAHMARPHQVSFCAGIDNRNSFVSTSKKVSLDIGGVKGGVTFLDKHTLGIGFYSAVFSQETNIVDEQQNPLKAKVNIGFATLYYQYTALKNRWWEISFPLELGAGYYQQTLKDSAGKTPVNFTDTVSKGIVLLGGGFQVSFKLFRWLGFGVMGGYRSVAGDEPKKINLNGFFYSYGVEIYLGYLWKKFKYIERKRGYETKIRRINRLYP